MQNKSPTKIIYIGFFFAAVNTPALAQMAAPQNEGAPAWPFCHRTTQNAPDYLRYDPTISDEQQRTHLEADSADKLAADHFQLSGEVKIWRGQQWIEAHEALYNSTRDEAEVTGRVRLGNLNLSAQGENGKFNLAHNQGRIDNAQYSLFAQHARGQADEITFESLDLTRLRNARYTTCDEGSSDWYINAHHVTLDRAEGFGTAQPVYITFFRVPILFSPYLSFPIDDRRKTGFLAPTFGNSTRSGDEFSWAYYLNLAPNYDGTINPHFMSRRGTMLETEWRYLFEKNQGNLRVDYLSEDKAYGSDRSLYALTHTSRPARDWYGTLDFQYVSDGDYLEDFGNSLHASTTSHLDERAQLSYIANHTEASVLLHGYQTVDKEIPEAQRPYRRLPQLTFNHWTPLWNERLQAELLSEYVYFDRTDRITGQRGDATPSLSLPLSNEAMFLTPKVSARLTEYQLEDEPNDKDLSYSRSLPLTSIDGGIILERDTHLFGKGYTQTLEPRVFYVNAPYKDQENIPIFDTAPSTFSYSQLFLEDRFVGADRVGDTEQVSLSLTSRLYSHNSGLETLSGGIGQIFYLRDRRVTLGQDQRDQANQSDIIGEANARLDQRWRGRLEAIWNHETDVVDKGSARLSYSDGPKRYLATTYYWDRADINEQTDVALIWPVSARWQLVGRHLFAHRETRTIEALAGLEYSSCCWSLSILHRSYQYAPDDKRNESIMLQLHLKGLASLGSPIEDIIRENILGKPKP